MNIIISCRRTTSTMASMVVSVRIAVLYGAMATTVGTVPSVAVGNDDAVHTIHTIRVN